MTLRTRIGLAAGVLLALAGAVYWNHQPALAPPVEEARQPLKMAWKVGDWWAYSFEYVTHSSVTWMGPAPGASAMVTAPQPDKPGMPHSQVGGDATVRGRFELTSVPVTGSAFRLVLRVTELSQLDVTVLDRNVFPVLSEAQQNVSALAVAVDIEQSGKLQRILLPREGEPALVHMLQELAGRLELSLDGSGDSTWKATESGPFGRAEARYSRNGAEGLRRSRDRYVAWTSLPSHITQERQDITSNGTITLDAGVLSMLRDDEVVRMTSRGTGENLAKLESRLAIDLVEHGTGDLHEPLNLAAFEVRAPDQHLPRLDTERQLLAARAAGFTREELVQRVLVPPVNGSAETNAWFNHATAYLKLNPSECDGLVASFQIAPGGGRLLLMDLLATVGSTEAQSAVRKMLSSPGLPDAFRGKLVERLSKLETPDAETVKYVTAMLKPGKSDERDSVIYTLGALIRHAGPRGVDTTEALSPLLRGLHDAKTPRDRVAFLDSLGNAGLPEQVREVTAFAKDVDPDVRRSVADALRFTPTPEAQRTLIDLSKDPNGRVQGQAFQVLSAQPSTPAMLVELEEVVKSGGVDPEAGPALLTLLKEKRGEGPVIDRMLATTADDTHLTPQVRAAARQIRAREKQ